MGALHEGHATLIREARRGSECVVVSIFVNPLQFDRKDDLDLYPRTLDSDLALCRELGVDVVFAPTAGEMYPVPPELTIQVGRLAEHLCGASRPGHFQGVATVVLKLLQIVQPTRAYFGQKDYQQSVIVRQMVRDLNCPVAVRVLPTVREADGLAMSSRNAYLTPAQRRQAPVIFQALREARALIRAGECRAPRLQRCLRAAIERQPLLRVQDISIVDAETLQPLERLAGRVAVLVAARLGSTHLIDNLLVDVP